MVFITAPWKHHFFLFANARLVCWVAWISRASSIRAISRHLTTLGQFRGRIDRVCTRPHIWANIHSSCTTPWSTYNDIMIVTTLYIGNFGIQKSEYHLREWSIVVDGLILIDINPLLLLSIKIFIGRYYKVRYCLLLSTKLSPIINPHWIHEPTRSKQQCMLEPTCHLWYESWLNLFNWYSDYRLGTKKQLFIWE